MRLVFLLSVMVMMLSSQAHGQQVYVESDSADGYIGTEEDLQNGQVVGVYGDENQDNYAPAPSDYRKKRYPRPKYTLEKKYQQWEDTYQPPAKDSAEMVYQRALEETNGACNTKKNPHSYACTDWNFKGNGLFPLFTMQWWDVMQGPWFSVTYVRPTSGKIKCANGVRIKGGENNDCEFSMKKNPQRPTQPLGIANTLSGELMGQMNISGDSVSWENWLGKTVWSEPSSLKQTDDYTMQFEMYTGEYSHLFICRDFNRNDNHHLTCKWMMWFPGSDHWVEKGYMGFLTQEVWDGFIQSQQ